MKRTNIGGQAVMEGVMMRGATSMALAVRDADGLIRLQTKRLKTKKSFWRKIPILRGIINFVLTLIDGTKTLMKSASVFGESEPTKFEKWVSKKLKIDVMSVVATISMLVGLGLAVVLFIMLPNAIPKWLNVQNKYWIQLVAGLAKVVILFAYLLLVSMLKDIRRTFMYHGAEHKTISCYEHELEMNVKNAQSCSTLHDRCGTTFLFFVVLVSIIVSLFIPIEDLWLRILVRFLTLPLVSGLAYELLKGLAKTNFWLLYPLKLPGFLMQKITTKQPTDDMVEVAICAFNAVLAMDADPNLPEQDFVMQQEYKKVYNEIAKEFADANIDDLACIDWIACSVLKVKRGELAEKVVSPKNIAKIKELCNRRIAGEPLGYILSETEFWGNKISLTADVLIPRMETELVTETAFLTAKKKNSKQILDLCTGSGCIAITLAKKLNQKVYAVDISEKALEVAKKNAEQNQADVEFLQSDMLKDVNTKFDLIVCNPPYIKTADIDTLDCVVKDFEPKLALDGGEDGLKFYRYLAENVQKNLNPNGILILEIGAGQSQDLKSLFAKQKVEVYKDYAGIDRIVKITIK